MSQTERKSKHESVNEERLYSIASKLGIKIETVDSSQLATDSSTLYVVTKLNPHHLYGQPEDEFDAILCWKQSKMPINWSTFSEAMITKWIKNPYDQTCHICFEEVALMNLPTCSGCHGQVCNVCMMRYALTEIVIFRIYHGLTSIEYSCPQCKCTLYLDLLTMYYRIMDKLDKFPQSQRAALLFMKQTDPNYHAKLKKWNDNYFAFKRGSVVLIQGLKRKVEWNGKYAAIIGDKVVRDEVCRWPVVLKDGAKGLVKEHHLNLVQADDK